MSNKIGNYLMEKYPEKINLSKAINIIFETTFNQTVNSKKTIFMILISYLPVFLAFYYRFVHPTFATSPSFVLLNIMLFFLLFVSMLVALFYATSVIGDEIDNKTIIYLFTRPVPKYIIVIGKFLAYVLGVLVILIPPILISFLVILSDIKLGDNFSYVVNTFAAQLAVIILSVVVYGAIFMFFGSRLKHPIIAGMLLAFGWEKITIIVPGLIRKFSVVHYLISVFPIESSMQSELNEISKGANSDLSISLIMIAVITIVFFGLTIYTLYDKEYKFE